MKIIAALLTAIAGALTFSAHAADRYVLDPGHTYPSFTIDHLGFSVMSGRFNQSEGSLVIDRTGDKSRLDVVIAAASIDTGHDKRDEHLRNEDFFDVEKYPTITYTSRSVSWNGQNRATVQGELSMHGVTRPVTLDVSSIRCGRHPFKQVYVCGFDATTTLNRSDFGMTSYAGAVGDEVQIRIEAEATRQESGAGPRK